MSNREPTYNDLWRNGQLRDQIDSMRDENHRLRQSLHEARELIEVMVTYHWWVPGAALDAARKWLEENGDAHP